MYNVHTYVHANHRIIKNGGWALTWRWALTRELLFGFLTHLWFYQPGALAGSTTIFVLFVCLLVDCAMSGEAWEQINGVTADMCGWLEFIGPPTCSWFVHLIMAKAAKRFRYCRQQRHSSPCTSIILQKDPRSTGMARNQWLTINQLRSENAMVLQYSVSYMRAPWSSRPAASTQNAWVDQ